MAPILRHPLATAACRVARSGTANIGLALLLFLSGMAPVEAADGPRVTLAQGLLAGGVADDVESFQSIPYAAAPVGKLRWRAPQSPPHWQGTRDATRPGAVCTQPIRPGASGPAPSEDCLFVNVWRPAGTRAAVGAGAGLPVMVWYHGGGMVFGSGSATDGRALARKGVILVTLNYRLGHMGVFAHPALSAESQGSATGNFTLMDAVAALNWVRTNISAFGGDPGRVTIFGFSAGAQIVNTLMVTPAARGLFARAITQSGLGRNYGHQGQNSILPIRGSAPRTGEKAGLALAETLGVRGTGAQALAALRAIPADRFKIAVTSLPGSMIDGALLPEPIAAGYAGGREAPVPQVIGRTLCERCGVESIVSNPEATFARAGALRQRAIALYRGNGAAAAVELASDLDHSEPARYLSRLHARNGRPTWSYVYGYTPAGQRGKKSGPSHGDDIPFIFGTVADGASGEGRSEPPTTQDLQVSDTIVTFWTNFAKSGDPGSAAGVEWPRFGGDGEENVMVFTDDGPKIDAAFRKDRLDLAEQINDSFQARSFVPQ